MLWTDVNEIAIELYEKHSDIDPRYILFTDLHKKSLHLTEEEAEGFYIEHKGKPFFSDLIAFMTSGPIQVQILEGDNAFSKYRELMGNTDPKAADPGTIRADFADSIDANAVHGSDSEKSAEREIQYFFSN